METQYKCFESSSGNVWKYVFDFKNALTEVVLYQYESFANRTVLCVSVQCGCPIGCTFCGTGDKFIRNLTSDEIVHQVKSVLDDKNIYNLALHGGIEKFQIMFMSMGEPFMNFKEVRYAIERLHFQYPKAHLLLSTTLPKVTSALSSCIELSQTIKKVGLQFSIHESCDENRNKLIPFKNKHSLVEIRDYGIDWFLATGRKPYCNYCVNGNNNTEQDFINLRNLFPPRIFSFTFSVICSKDETVKDSGYRNLDSIREFEQKFLSEGYDTRIFDPAGQDDISGGCGQLAHFQRYINK